MRSGSCRSEQVGRKQEGLDHQEHDDRPGEHVLAPGDGVVTGPLAAGIVVAAEYFQFTIGSLVTFFNTEPLAEAFANLAGESGGLWRRLGDAAGEPGQTAVQ